MVYRALSNIFRLYEAKTRGRSWNAATFKMEHFVIIVNALKPLTVITTAILDIAGILDQPLKASYKDITVAELQAARSGRLYLAIDETCQRLI